MKGKMAFFGPKVLGERQNVAGEKMSSGMPRTGRPDRKYAKRGKLHYHRCPSDTFLWQCFVADCKLPKDYICRDCEGHFMTHVHNWKDRR